ncbi:butyrophilin-like protein 1 isoform X2 [Paralichthys olivaceus]|uniref:butyrophilin-like protein 1 isoform X2 n=1 Tax=Paralichthys olivaceus TaxID=8255 RepID=UPI003753390C
MSFISCGEDMAASNTPCADPVIVKEGDDVMLPCSFSSSSIRRELFDWEKDKKDVFKYHSGDINPSHQGETFRGRVSHFPEQLDVGNASIVIRDTKVTDSGTYTCAFPLLQPARESNIVLVVDPILKDRSDANIPGAASKPSVTNLNQTQNWAQLQCEVHGASPKPVVQWQNRAGDIVPAKEPQVSERGGRYDIILQTTVTKTDYYRCVSTQEEIKHQTHAETYVLLNDTRGTLPVAAGVPVWAVVGVAVLALLVGGLVVHFVHKNKKSTSPKSSSDRPDSSEGTSLNRDVC